MAINYQTLKTELDNDPLALGYAGKSDEDTAGLLNAVGENRDGMRKPQDVIPAYDLVNAVDPDEWAALQDLDKTRFQTIVAAGQVKITGSNIQTSLNDMFPAGTKTQSNIAALAYRPASRADVVFGEPINYWDVARARAL